MREKKKNPKYPYIFFNFRKLDLILETTGPNKVVQRNPEPEMLTYLIFRALRSNQK